jgi:esterase/lipase superfamily enzyme
MTKWLVAFLLVIFGIADAAHAQDRWSRVNSVTASVGSNQVLIDASGWTQGCKGIRIAVLDATIAIEHISIVYSTGRVHAEKLSPPVRVGPGARSRVFASTDDARQIRLVTLRFTRVDRAARAATIELWGLQPAPSRPGAPAMAQRREFKLETEPRGGAAPPPATRSARPAPPATEETSRMARERTPSEFAPRSRGMHVPAPSARAPEPMTAPPSEPATAARPAPPATVSRSLAAPPEPEKKYTEVDVFFGTDRKKGADRVKFGRKVASFDSGSTGQLTLGKAVVTVPKEGREKGSIPRPEWDFIISRFSLREDVERHFTVFAVDVLDRDAFIREARAKLAGSRRFAGQALVFVHGYFVTFDDALFRAAQIAHDLEFDGVPFVYSWPSVGGLLGYILDRGSARDARDQLREFVNLVSKESGAKEVHLIAHSMGADPLLEVLRDISNSETPVAGSRPRFGEIILAAPDVTRESFERIASQITGIRRRMTLYASSNDRALTVSGWARLGEPPAGYVPIGGPVIVPGIVDTIDVSGLDTSFFGLNHSTFADREVLLGDMRRLISSGMRPSSNRGPEFEQVEVKGGSGSHYWRYKK